MDLLTRMVGNIRNVLGTKMLDVQLLISDNFTAANTISELIYSLSIKTGLTHKEIGNLTFQRFLKLSNYHGLLDTE